MPAPPRPRFAFLVHALTPFHRRVQGLRTANPGLFLGRRDGTAPRDIARLARLGLDGVVDGVIVGIPMTPAQMLEDQERALARMERAAVVAGSVSAIGLGSLCAVVAGRGEALAERLEIPVTTGAAATAWAVYQNTVAVLGRVGGPVAVVGAAGAVGQAVAALLAEAGQDVRVDHGRAARGLPVKAFASPEEAVAGCPVVVGAGPTGYSLAPEALAPGAILVDVALPHTLNGPVPRGVRVLEGESVSLPAAWRRDGWGQLYHLLAGYGPTAVFACVVEPLVLAATGRGRPFALGRKVSPSVVRAFGEEAEKLGFLPRLSRGWRQVALGSLKTERLLTTAEGAGAER